MTNGAPIWSPVNYFVNVRMVVRLPYLGQRQRKMVHTIKNTDLLIYNTLNKMKKLELIDINKSYDTNVPVLKNVSFSVENGEFLVLLGPSGCGKSTILSIIAGFEKQNDGSVIIDGRNCDTVSCQNRDIAMVFQNYALYLLEPGGNSQFGLN